MSVINISNPNQVYHDGQMISTVTDDLRQQKTSVDQVHSNLQPSWTGTDAYRYLEDLKNVSAYLNATIALLDNYGIIIRNSMSRYSNISES